MSISILQQQLINQYQKGFPLCTEPFKKVADELGYSEIEVLDAVQDLDKLDILSRVGPVFDHKKAGASTLAAIAVPESQRDEIAAIINQFDAVNHNYARRSHSLHSKSQHCKLQNCSSQNSDLQDLNLQGLDLQEKSYNLWFVVTACNAVTLKAVLDDIAKQTGFSILVLPMEASYHIDLSFKVDFSGVHHD